MFCQYYAAEQENSEVLRVGFRLLADCSFNFSGVEDPKMEALTHMGFGLCCSKLSLAYSRRRCCFTAHAGVSVVVVAPASEARVSKPPNMG
ncbi:hypothetical protein Dimus_026076 [Dionaea muscipula]